MKQRCPDIIILERFVLEAIPDRLENETIRKHVQTCLQCGFVVNNLIQLYSQIDTVSEETIDRILSRVDFVNSSKKSFRIFPLIPLDRPEIRPTAYVLAADTAAKTRFTNIQSYVTKDESLLARMMLDNQSNEVTCFLISENPLFYRDSVLEINGLPERWRPDQQGKITFKGLGEPEIINREIHLRTPLATFDLAPFSNIGELLLKQKTVTIRNQTLDTITIEIDSQHKKDYYRIKLFSLRASNREMAAEIVVVQKDESFVCSPLHEDSALFESFDPDNVLRIFIR